MEREEYAEPVFHNDHFVRFYRGKIVPMDEWDQFYAALKRPLPTTFRITGTRTCATILRSQLEEQFNGLGPSVDPPSPIPWHPDMLAWTMCIDKRTLRRDPSYSKLHTLIVRETERGNISRQEAVSMIPPLLLDVSGEHYVLDMCASPGSKTCQLVEMMHGSGDTVPKGVVIANDVDLDRSRLLIHQTKRMNTPCLMVTYNDARTYPNVGLEGNKVLFDRILCDVPCSGDGTMRKNPLIWKKWTPSIAHGLHQLQVDILRRGCQLLKPGGRLVYSTCSLNPVENEAVLLTVLSEHPQSLKVVNVSSSLKGLERKPGLVHWMVMVGGLDYEEYTQVPDHQRSSVKPSCFSNRPECLRYGIENSIRIYPHLQDTGGFFIAVIEKTVESLPDSVCSTSKPHSQDDNFIFQVSDSALSRTLRSLYGLEQFPFDQLVSRSKTAGGNLFLASRGVRDIIHHGLGLKILHFGIQAFTRTKTERDVEYRIQYESLLFVLPFITKRRIEISQGFKDLLMLISKETCEPAELSIDFQEKMFRMEHGCVICSFLGSPEIHVPVRKGKRFLNLLVNKQERLSLGTLLSWIVSRSR